MTSKKRYGFYMKKRMVHEIFKGSSEKKMPLKGEYNKRGSFPRVSALQDKLFANHPCQHFHIYEYRSNFEKNYANDTSSGQHKIGVKKAAGLLFCRSTRPWRSLHHIKQRLIPKRKPLFLCLMTDNQSDTTL